MTIYLMPGAPRPGTGHADMRGANAHRLGNDGVVDAIAHGAVSHNSARAA